ncbi:hypothetical protein C8E83_1512 [Frondihabitans australicus]|uniref:Uncharacterized protein n=2 Tax=Frondihabitans australicus TaxID=386892 RepID=A0A495IFH0_9MICO|nr:hypothetical protein C8E83_1512 [Frondihabitans australicus]
MAIGGLLLALATAAEYFVLGPGTSPVLFAGFMTLFVAAAVVLASAGPLLASGGWRWAPHGLVGDSPLGHLAVYAFSGCWFLSLVAYIGYTYVFRTSAINYDLVAVSTALIVISVLAGLVAGVTVVRAGVAHGFSRWSLFGALACAIASAVVIGSTDSLVVITVVKIVTALALGVVGFGYYRAQER